METTPVMPAIFEYRHTVAPEEIDALGHANNVAYVAWMQAAALAHSAAQGWSAERYQALGRGWVVRAHQIEYLRPVALAEELTIRTWVATMEKVTSLRRYEMFRADGELVARGETRWAFVSYATGQPARIPSEIASAFEVVSLQGRPA
jgi:acyl-CoA thioester hydrolase